MSMPDDASLVLVIDDDASLRRPLDSLLRSSGFLVECYASIDAFLRRDPPQQPCCLLLDAR